MVTNSSLIAGISFVILVSGEIWMFREVTKIIRRFCFFKRYISSKELYGFILTVFLLFTLYYSTWMTPLF